MVTEVSIKISNEEMKLVEKFLLYDEGLTLSHDDITLKSMVDKVINKFKGDIDDITITARFTY